MIRKLIIINLALVVALLALVQQLRERMRLTKQREDAILLLHVPPADVPQPAKLGKVPPLDATAFQDAVAKNLFSRDRNPVPIPDPPPPPPPPPPVPAFPVARGVMLWEGLPPTVVLSTSKASGDQKGYHPGDKVGDWKLLAVDNQYIVLEWNGKQFKKRLDELMDRTPVEMVAAPPTQAAAVAPVPAVKSLGDKNGMGADMGGTRACIAGDTAPPGTVNAGYRKVVSATPFGSVCRWEPVQ